MVAPRPDEALPPWLDAALARARRGDDAHPVAAFDADGTLWEGDVGDRLFEALVRRGLLAASREEYRARLQVDPAAAWRWACSAMAGIRVDAVRRVAREVVASHVSDRLFGGIRSALAQLHAAGWRIAVVSASSAWVVRAAVRILHLPVDAVCGVENELAGGRLRAALRHPVPVGAGKVDAVRGLAGRLPSLAAGNSTWDIPLLESARHTAVAVWPDRGLRDVARRRGWHQWRPARARP